MMQIFKNTFFVLFAISFLVACGANKKQQNTSADPAPKAKTAIVVGTETRLLLDDLAENGDYVNGRNFPSLIKASSVLEQLDDNLLLVDIRSKAEYTKGHIKGAVNQSFSDLLNYFEGEIKPFEYNRIVIISSDGQSAGYTTSLLRLMGYGNVYALRWGMSGWNMQAAKTGWLAGCGSAFEKQLETAINEKMVASALPQLKTGKTTGEEIGALRFQQLFADGLDPVTIDAATVFANPSAYYVINYDRRDKYESGHIPGAIRYKPGATLSIVTEMATIAHDKTVVVYCGTGHNSAFVTAYLRLFGYNAKTLNYGNNSFMHDKMIADKATLSWLPFTAADVNDFEVVK